MANILVIGGGLSGLSSAIYLSRDGHQVKLIEASPKMGGRTYSFFDNITETEIDNGQHIMMGAYKTTFEFLKIIGSDNVPFHQKSLDVKLTNSNNKKLFLNASNGFYPFNLIKALLLFDGISKIEKLKTFSFIAFGLWKKPKENDALTWLRINGQSENVIKSLWEIIGVGALNTQLSEASAETLRKLLRKIFLSGNKSSTIVLPRVPLSELFIEPVVNYFRKNSITFQTSEKVRKITVEDNKVVKVATNRANYSDFDFYVLAIPHYAVGRIVSNENLLGKELTNMENSPIITVHLWFKEFNQSFDFIGFIDMEYDWIFNNGSHISIVISAADKFIKETNVEILKIILDDLKKLSSGLNIDNLVHYTVLKEKRATFKCTPKNEVLRSQFNSKFKNLFFAGDWTNTNLPGTIEGAIQSGKFIAKKIN